MRKNTENCVTAYVIVNSIQHYIVSIVSDLW